MIVSSALINKLFIVFLLLLLLYFVTMDVLLYSRVKNYEVRPMARNRTKIYKNPWIPCDVNPLCTVTVKGLMLDHPNHYILSPLAAVVDNLLGISRSWTWLTPNAISIFHVFVAIAAGRCIASDSLSTRRLGVIFFQLRTWMDDLDGRVARKRANILGERSDVGSIGFLVDGICDGLGCIALIVGLFYFFLRNPAKRGSYEKLQQLPLSGSSLDSVYVATTRSSSWSIAVRKVLLLAGHLIVMSATWNRYISLYQDLLEMDSSSLPINADLLYARQTYVFRSGSFWAIILGWKIINFHAALDYLLLAIFLDRIWEFAKLTRWSFYIIVLFLVYVTEFHFTHAYQYVNEAFTGLPSEFDGITTSDVVRHRFAAPSSSPL